MKRLYRAVKLYMHYVSIILKSMMQYKSSFVLSTIGQFLVSFNVFLGIFFMFKRFTGVEGFTYSEVVLCFSIMLLEFSIAEMIARGFDAFDSTVKTGEFDRILVRPRSEIIQVLGSKFELTRIGRMIQAVVMFIYGINRCKVVWDCAKVFTVILMIAGGVVVFASIFLIYAALCFFTIDGLEFMNVFTDGAREFGIYPIGIYGKKMLLFSTYVVPYALIQYYPLLYILGRRTDIYLIFLPIAACLFACPAIILWKYGVKHYKSSGS